MNNSDINNLANAYSLIKEAAERPQSIPNGTQVRFRLEDVDPHEFNTGGELNDELLRAYDGKVATVEALATATEMGEKDYEYYDISFQNGFKLHGVSGYHLTPIEPAGKQREITSHNDVWNKRTYGKDPLA